MQPQKIMFAISLMLFSLSFATASNALTPATEALFKQLGIAWAGLYCDGKEGQAREQCCQNLSDKCSQRCEAAAEDHGSSSEALDDCLVGCNTAHNACTTAAAPDAKTRLDSLLELEQIRLINKMLMDAAVPPPYELTED